MTAPSFQARPNKITCTLEGQAYGGALEQNLAGMNDSIEGPLAFSEKRRPKFTDT